eukprot:15471511-Alexandrium_andersonii.AAC.1
MARAKAPATITPQQYDDAVLCWLEESRSSRPLDLAFGPLCFAAFKVTKDALLRGLGLLEKFIDLGCDQGV